MKIAQLVSTFYPKVGGMGAVVYDESAFLASHGHDVTVFTMRYGAEPETEVREGFTIKRLKPRLRFGDGGVVSFPVFDADVVHVHAPWYGSMVMAARAAIKAGARLVVTHHMDGAPKNIFKKVVATMLNRVEVPVVFANAKKVFVVNRSYFDVSTAARYADPAKTIDLPNPVDIRLFRPLPASNGSVPFNRLPGEKIILFVGNLLPLKRLDLLLNALAAGEVSWRLVVVGAGYDAERYKAMAKDLALFHRVEFAGAKTRIEMPLYYRAADCVAVPSASESFSLVALEAMACGAPVVMSSVPGAGDWVRVGAFGFRPGSVSDLVRAIKECLDESSENRVARTSKARAYIADTFNLEAHVRTLEKEYQTV